MVFVRFWIALFISLAAVLAGALALAGEAARGVQSDEDAMIQVKSVVEVDGRQMEIVLGDLMSVRGLDSALLNDMRMVRLADMPKAGESRSFTAMGLEQVFRPMIRDLELKIGAKVVLRLPARVMVMRKSFHLKPKDIEDEIVAQFRQVCAECQFEIANLSLPAVPANVPSGATWSVRFKHVIPKGSFSVPLEVDNDDGSTRTYWISGIVSVSRKVPVASRAVAAGEHLLPEDFSFQLRDVTFATDSPATEADFASSVTARSIAAGQTLWRSSLAREVALKNGEVVKVVAGSADWQVSIDGIAQSSAYIGDTVNVKIPRTAKLVSGRLTERGIVEVRE